jgi:hypothetical protein
MNYQKVGLLAMYYLPKPKKFRRSRIRSVHGLAGRNVGQSTTSWEEYFIRFTLVKNNNKRL